MNLFTFIYGQLEKCDNSNLIFPEFVQKEYIKLSKSDCKYIYNITKDFCTMLCFWHFYSSNDPKTNSLLKNIKRQNYIDNYVILNTDNNNYYYYKSFLSDFLQYLFLLHLEKNNNIFLIMREISDFLSGYLLHSSQLVIICTKNLAMESLISETWLLNEKWCKISERKAMNQERVSILGFVMQTPVKNQTKSKVDQ